MRPALLLIVLLSCLNLSAQKEILLQNDTLEILRRKIMEGDTGAFRAIGYFLDSKKEVLDVLGYHMLRNEERSIAKRIITENTFFTEDELKLDSTLTAARYHAFLNTNKERIHYSEEISGFLITPFEARQTDYKLRQMDSFEITSLNKQLSEESYPGWIFENNIDYYIKTQDPRCLVRIASYFLHQRLTWNNYDFNEEEYINYLKHLTHLELGVPNDEGKISFLYKMASTEARTNLLIYFITHINDYKWDEKEQYFRNTKETGEAKDREVVLFGLLNSDDDTVALNAFIMLLEGNDETVSKLAYEYDAQRIDHNYSLPTFPYSFLKQGSILTKWCRDNSINYKPSGVVASLLDSLSKEFSFTQLYRLENRLINTLTLDEVTMLEYYGLIHTNTNFFTHSAGRILDKFYSRNWTKLLAHEKHLLTYLKKSVLFDRLGIIGICNKYLMKFENCSPAVLERLQSLKSKIADKDIQEQIDKVLATYKNPLPFVLPKITQASGIDYHIGNLRSFYKKIIRSSKNSNDKEMDLKELFGKISYKQLGEALEILAQDTMLVYSDKYYMLKSDFGFYLGEYDSATITRFRENYAKLTEREMYHHNLVESGTDIFTATGKLDYNKVYDVLKYDVVDAFAGGGGARRDDNVYPVIKLLEFEFNTRLGFPQKLCSWQGIWGCDCTDQMHYWMNFLREKGLVTIDPTEPRSISYN